jgi:PadR family transcriptional regulator, regulatory protein PadR
MKLRMSPQTVLVLSEFLQAPQHWKYGYDISRNTGLKSGTLYPILMRLAEQKLLETRWEAAEAGKPPRHMYKLTIGGLRYAREHIPSVAKLKHPVRQLAFSEVKS